MTSPLYGAEGTAYPVQVGDVWRVGPHVLACGDMRDYTPPAEATLVYCDPPWGKAMMTQFHRKAGLPGTPDWDWAALYDHVITLAHNARAPLFIECGNQQRDEVRDMLPGPVIQEWDVTYAHGNPSVLFYTGTSMARTPDLTGCDDALLPRIILGCYPPGLVTDPCAGRGTTTLAAHTRGWSSHTNELNPARVSAALARLAKATGQEPTKGGHQ